MVGKHCCGCDSLDFIDDWSESKVFTEVEFLREAQDKNAIAKVLNGDIQLVYISPESLLIFFVINLGPKHTQPSTIGRACMDSAHIASTVCVGSF